MKKKWSDQTGIFTEKAAAEALYISLTGYSIYVAPNSSFTFLIFRSNIDLVKA